MKELILMPDTELAIINHLRNALAERSEAYTNNVYLGVEVPATRRDRMVIVRRHGGRSDAVVRDTAIVRLWIWAPTNKEVSDLTAMVRGLMPLAADGKPILYIRENSGPVALVDESEQAQRLITFEVFLRGTSASTTSVDDAASNL